MSTLQELSEDGLRLHFFLRSGLPFIMRILESADRPSDFRPVIEGFRQDLLKSCGIDFRISDQEIWVYQRGNYICKETVAAVMRVVEDAGIELVIEEKVDGVAAGPATSA